MKYLDLRALPLVWTKICSNPFRSTQGSVPLACIVNGRFSLFYAMITATNPQRYAGCVLYSFDSGGSICTYKSKEYRNGLAINTIQTPNGISLAGNQFQFGYNDGSVYSFTVPPVFLPGATVTVPALPLTNALPPCGVGNYVQTLLMGQQNLIAYEFAHAFEVGADIFASIFTTSGQLVGAGYIGNSPSGSDIFNLTNNELPPFVQLTDVYYKNGSNIYGNFDFVYPQQQVIGFNTPYLNGDPTQLACGGSGTPSVNVTSTYEDVIYPYRDFGCPSFTYNSIGLAYGITDLKNQFIFCEDSTFFFLSRDYMAQLTYTPFSGSPSKIGFLSAQNLLIGESSPNTNVGGDVYIASFDPLPIAPLPIVSRASYTQLSNYHRAVSPGGIFLA